MTERGEGFFANGKFYLIRCFDCGRENYASAMSSGRCVWCGSATNPTERWLPVRSYEGLYAVSDFGRVMSLDRTIPFRDQRPTRRDSKRTGVQRRKGRIRALMRRPNNILEVALYKDDTRRHMSVARLVFEAFVGPIPPNYIIFWKDGDRTNNRSSNLGVKLADGLSQERPGLSPRLNDALDLLMWRNAHVS